MNDSVERVFQALEGYFNQRKSNLAAVFRNLDKQHTGFISHEACVAGFTTMGLGLDSEDMRAFTTFADPNNDGQVEYHELMRSFKQYQEHKHLNASNQPSSKKSGPMDPEQAGEEACEIALGMLTAAHVIARDTLRAAQERAAEARAEHLQLCDQLGYDPDPEKTASLGPEHLDADPEPDVLTVKQMKSLGNTQFREIVDWLIGNSMQQLKRFNLTDPRRSALHLDDLGRAIDEFLESCNEQVFDLILRVMEKVGGITRSRGMSLKALFMQWDNDHSGNIDTEELQDALSHLGLNIAPWVMRRFCSYFDKGGRGILLEEFQYVYYNRRQLSRYGNTWGSAPNVDLITGSEEDKQEAVRVLDALASYCFEYQTTPVALLSQFDLNTGERLCTLSREQAQAKLAEIFAKGGLGHFGDRTWSAFLSVLDPMKTNVVNVRQLAVVMKFCAHKPSPSSDQDKTKLVSKTQELEQIPPNTELSAAVLRIFQHCAHRHTSIVNLLRVADRKSSNQVSFEQIQQMLKNNGCRLSFAESSAIRKYFGSNGAVGLEELARVFQAHAREHSVTKRASTTPPPTPVSSEPSREVLRSVQLLKRRAEAKGQSLVFLCRSFDMLCKGYLSEDELFGAAASVRMPNMQDALAPLIEHAHKFWNGQLDTQELLDLGKACQVQSMNRKARSRPHSACGVRELKPKRRPRTTTRDWRETTGRARRMLVNLQTTRATSTLSSHVELTNACELGKASTTDEDVGAAAWTPIQHGQERARDSSDDDSFGPYLSRLSPGQGSLGSLGSHISQEGRSLILSEYSSMLENRLRGM